MSKLDTITPGEILLEEFLIPMGLSQYRLAKEIGVPAQRISEIVAGKRSVTADTDLWLCPFFWSFKRLLVESAGSPRHGSCRAYSWPIAKKDQTLANGCGPTCHWRGCG